MKNSPTLAALASAGGLLLAPMLASAANPEPEVDEVIVKHDNEYDAENKDRLQQSNQEAAACSQKG